MHASMIKAFDLVLSKEQIASRSLVDSIFGMHDFLKIDPKWVFSFLETKSNWHPPKKSVMNVVTLLIKN